MTRRPRWNNATLLLLALCALYPAYVRAAQSVTWRTDYAAARKEAFEKNKPLLLVFGGDYCTWCRKLETTTLRDPAVVGALLDRFICLKIDGEREVGLTQALNVQTFPTIVVAASDGKIVSTIDGYTEANKLMTELNKAAPPVMTPAPDWMLHDFQDAARAIAISDYSRAIVLLRAVVKDGGERSIQVKSRHVLSDLESQATAQLTLARTLQQRGRSQEAADVLTDLLRSYAGTNAATESTTLLTALAAKPEVREGMRVRKARELLALAKEDFHAQQFLGCMERCEVLVASFSDLHEGTEARKIVGNIQDNPEYLAKACEALNHRSAAMYLSLADSWMKKGQHGQASECLERVVQIAPGSRHADAAQTRLAAMQNSTRTSAYPPSDRKPQ